MSITFSLFCIGLFTSTVLVAILVKRRLQGNIVATFPARIIDIQRTTTWAYVGLFIPITSSTLIIEGNRKVGVNEWDAKRVQIGDMVRVSQYSTGKYRFTKRSA